MPLLASSPARLRRRGRAVVVELRGDLDLQALPAVRGALAVAVDEHDGPVVVDCTRVPLVTSTLIATLLNALRRLTRAGRRMAVVPGPQGQRVLHLTQLDTTFRSCPDVATALERCGA